MEDYVVSRLRFWGRGDGGCSLGGIVGEYKMRDGGADMLVGYFNGMRVAVNKDSAIINSFQLRGERAGDEVGGIILELKKGLCLEN